MSASTPLRTACRRFPALAHGGSARTSRRAFSVSVQRQKVYGFIGLGRMGHAMAANLRAKIAKEDTLLVNDKYEPAMKAFVDEVGTAAAGHNAGPVEGLTSVYEVAERSDIVITCLPDPKAVQSCFGNILPRNLPATPSGEARLFIDTSTIDPLTSRNVAEAIHSTQQGSFVDAPMSGGVVGARAGSLTFMLGASKRDGGALVERVTPILRCMGARVMHLGEQGAGLAGKLANNYLLAISNIATAEAMNLGKRLGLDGKTLAELVNTSSGRCWSSDVNNPIPGVIETAPASRDYEGGFGVALMTKDLGLALASAKEAGAHLELGDEAMKVYEKVSVAEKGKDFSVVYRWLGGE